VTAREDPLGADILGERLNYLGRVAHDVADRRGGRLLLPGSLLAGALGRRLGLSRRFGLSRPLLLRGLLLRALLRLHESLLRRRLAVPVRVDPPGARATLSAPQAR